MSVLVELPYVLLKQVLSYWLDIDDWSVLDSAMCSHLLRNRLLNAFHDIVGRMRINTDSHYRWVYKKGIIVTKLYFRTHFSAPIRYEYITTLIQIGPLCVDVFNACINLTSLECVDISNSQKLNPKIVGQLSSLTCESQHYFNILKSVSKYCTGLKELTLVYSSTDKTNSLLKNIIKCNPLESVDLTLTDDLVEGLIQHRSTTLTALMTQKHFALDKASTLLQKCPLLTRVEIGDDLEYIRNDYLQVYTPHLGAPYNLEDIVSFVTQNALEKLNIVSSINAKDELMTVVSLVASHVQELEVSQADVITLREILVMCKHLKKLTVKAVCFSPAECVLFECDHELRELNLGQFGHHTPAIDALHILHFCPHMTSLMLYGLRLDLPTLPALLDGMISLKNTRKQLSCAIVFQDKRNNTSLHLNRGQLSGSIWDLCLALRNVVRDDLSSV